MKRLVVTVIAAGAALTSLSAAAQFQKPEDAIKYRRSALTVMANHLGRVGKSHTRTALAPVGAEASLSLIQACLQSPRAERAARMQR